MTNDLVKFSGGGGGGSAPDPTRTPDTLRSEDTLEILLAVSEGVIGGWVDGKKSFFISDTPLQNSSGTYNFEHLEASVYTGVSDPDPVPMKLGGQGQSTGVSVSLATGIPVVRTTNQFNVDFLEVRLAVDGLYWERNDGIFQTSIDFQIEYKAQSSTTWLPFWTSSGISIYGKTTSRYIKEFRKPVPRINELYDIRVTKLSPESGNLSWNGQTTSVTRELSWDSFQEIEFDSTKVYKDTALIHFVAKATDQFSSLPTLSGVYKGMIVQVPSNYDPVARTYSGVWDGLFVSAWTNNPAWVLYDLVTNDRYGIRSYYKNLNFDKYDCYEAGVWCDERVPDGKGGTEPRYSMNLYLTDAMSGQEIAKYVAGAFNATFFDDLDGTAHLRVDKDDQAVHVVTQESVINGKFEYSYSDITTRYNDITVTFRNPDLNWKIDRRRIKNQEAIDKFGRIPLDFGAIGCTGVQEAMRRGQYKLITSLTETCFVKFSMTRRAQYLQPFDVILVSDPDMGYGITGRIKSMASDRQSVNLRDPVYLEAGVDYSISFVLDSGEILKLNLKNNITGYNSTLFLNGELPIGRVPDRTSFAIESTTLGNARPFRVLSITEQGGNVDACDIECVAINRNKWYDSDNVTDTGDVNYSVLPNPLRPPGADTCGFFEKFVRDELAYHLVVSPVFPRDTYKFYTNNHSFEVWSRPRAEGGNFVRRELQFGDTIINHPGGEYEFKILGKSYTGSTTPLSDAAVFVFTVQNPLDPPADIDWVRINKQEVYWGYVNPPDDFAGFRVRYHNAEGRTTWGDALQPHNGLLSATSFYSDQIPWTARVIMVKAVDLFGQESLNPAIISRPLGQPSHLNVVEEFVFDPTFTGTKVGCSVIGAFLKANTPAEASVYTGNPASPMYDGGDFYETIYDEMFWYPQFTTTGDGVLVVDAAIQGVGFEIDIKETSGSNWRPLGNSTFITADDYDLRVHIFGGKTQGLISSFKVTVDVEDIIDEIEDYSAPASSWRVPLTKTFPNKIKIVAVTIQNDGAATAVSYRVLDKDKDLGPLIELLDGTGGVVGGIVDIVVKGF